MTVSLRTVDGITNVNNVIKKMELRFFHYDLEIASKWKVLFKQDSSGRDMAFNATSLSDSASD